jgi:hypothetical protein
METLVMTLTISLLINAKVIQPNQKTRICKIIKQQIFTVRGEILDHLIGNIYRDKNTNITIDNKKVTEL